MKKERRIDLYVQDIITAIERILLYVEGHDLDSFQQNFMVADAVVRNFEIIGEAVKNIPKDLRTKYPDVPWDKMYQLRNIVSHEYFQVDYETLWKIITAHLQDNLKSIKEMFNREFSN